MPLDGHSYLVAQGWGGKGTGLRQGSISRPLAIPQKRTLAGLGKDRDEAFPFWDHLFAAAAKSIQVKIGGDGRDGRDDTSDSDDDASSSQPTLKRTSTGLLSNRRPTHGTPATSGTATPTTTDPNANPNIPPRLSLLATAKREAAKRSLYARFLRGPVVAPVSDIDVIVSQFESIHSGDSPGQKDAGSVEGRTTEKKGKKRDKEGKETKEVLGDNGKDERSRRKKEKRDRKTKEKENGDETRVKEKRHKDGKDKKEKEKKRKRTGTTAVEERDRTGDSDADNDDVGTVTLAHARPKKKRKSSHRSDVGNEHEREKTKVKAAAEGTTRELEAREDIMEDVQVELGDLGHENVTKKKRKKEKLHV